MKSIMLCIGISLFCLNFNYSQSRCETDHYHNELIQEIEYLKWYNLTRNEALSKVDYSRSVACASPIIIPVAVHYSGGVTAANTACLILKAEEQIQVLNEDFGGYNADITNYCDISAACCVDYPPSSITQGTCLQFCLATINHPACEPAGNLIGGYAITVGEHSWPSTGCWSGYLNLFVEDGLSILGQAPLSGGANPNGNGVQILASAFGGPGGGCNSGVGIDTDGTYNLGRTGTHEVGHYFGLDHIFNGCGAGDGVGDTPPQSSSNFGCPTVNLTTCANSASNTCGTPDFWFNFMDYVDDPCMWMFTEGQGQLMYNIAISAGSGGNTAYQGNASVCNLAQPAYVPTYLSTAGCPSSTIPESDFSPSTGALNLCPGETIDFLDLSTGCDLTGWAWTFSGAGVSPTSSTDQNPTVTVSNTGTLIVTLVASSATGSDPTPANGSISVTVLDTSDPLCSDCGNTFVDSGGTGGNYSNNENIEYTFCAPAGQVVEVEFTSFSIEFNGNCVWDVMEVFDGNSTAATSMGAFCGTNAPGGGTITSTGQCITFEFTSDTGVTDSGWEATINCVNPPTCNDGIENGDEQGIDCGGSACPNCISCGETFEDSGGSTENYSSNEDLSWTFCATTGQVISVIFTSFEVENNGANACYDALTVYDGEDNTNPNLGSFCGSGTGDAPGGGTITSTGECLTFNFTSDNSVTEGGWTADIVCATVPVSYGSLTAELRSNEVYLDWSTETEVNNEGFEIERSIDGINFSNIGWVTGNGNSTVKTIYNFVDQNIHNGNVYYYRLKQIDYSGNYEYSDVELVRVDGIENSIEFALYPNPNNGSFFISYPQSDELIEVQVFDKTGRNIKRWKGNLQNGEIEMNFEDLLNGVYSIKLIRGEQIEYLPFVILR